MWFKFNLKITTRTKKAFFQNPNCSMNMMIIIHGYIISVQLLLSFGCFWEIVIFYFLLFPGACTEQMVTWQSFHCHLFQPHGQGRSHQKEPKMPNLFLLNCLCRLLFECRRHLLLVLNIYLKLLTLEVNLWNSCQLYQTVFVCLQLKLAPHSSAFHKNKMLCFVHDMKTTTRVFICNNRLKI